MKEYHPQKSNERIIPSSYLSVINYYLAKELDIVRHVWMKNHTK
jgi:hypothetical protein